MQTLPKENKAHVAKLITILNEHLWLHGQTEKGHAYPVHQYMERDWTDKCNPYISCVPNTQYPQA